MSDSVEDYKRWVDEMVNRPESLRKAREHAPSRTLKRNHPKDEKTEIVQHPLADANPSAHTAEDSKDCDACTQAPGWFPGKYADVTMIERNRKAIELELAWIEKHPRWD